MNCTTTNLKAVFPPLALSKAGGTSIAVTIHSLNRTLLTLLEQIGGLKCAQPDYFRWDCLIVPHVVASLPVGATEKIAVFNPFMS